LTDRFPTAAAPDKEIDVNPRKFLAAAGTAAALALTLSACSGSAGSLPGQSSGSSSAVDTTLTLGLSSDISTPDPSSAYSGSEMNLVLAAYEGLVKYQTGVDKAEIVPSLATAWKVSDDALTYTFTLRDGVTFHDGTPLTSAAVQPSVDRSATVGAKGPGYMVGGITNIATPDDSTVVFTLGAPNAAFLDYLASPFGLKLISPAALTEHAEDDEWFATHDAGTGPYQYGSFEAGVKYQLTAYPTYWGKAGGYSTVEFSVVDSTNTIQLQLGSGELDGYIGSGNKPLFDALKTTKGLATTRYASMMAPVVFLNPGAPGLGDQATRAALVAGVDWDAIVSNVYGDLATSSTGVFPASMVPADDNVDALKADPAGLKALATGALSGQKITIGYPSFVPGAQEISDSLVAQLNTAGLTAESVGYESSAYWSTMYDPAKAPSLTLFSGFPDAAHPDTWARLFYSTKGGLNMFGGQVDGLDALLDEAVATGDTSLYAKAAHDVSASGLWHTLADLKVSGAFQDSVQGIDKASYPVLGITLDFTQLSPKA
jgi:peptide/nickel transport system substrate-binding protein